MSSDRAVLVRQHGEAHTAPALQEEQRPELCRKLRVHALLGGGIARNGGRQVLELCWGQNLGSTFALGYGRQLLRRIAGKQLDATRIPEEPLQVPEKSRLACQPDPVVLFHCRWGPQTSPLIEHVRWDVWKVADAGVGSPGVDPPGPTAVDRLRLLAAPPLRPASAAGGIANRDILGLPEGGALSHFSFDLAQSV